MHRKPTSLKIAEGDPGKIGKRKLLAQLAAEPKPMHGYPPCPTHLSGLARKTWAFLTEQLEFMNQDRRPDAILLEGACVAYARAVHADKVLTTSGLTVEHRGVIRKRPENEISNAAWLRVLRFCSEFGLSPVSRARLIADKDAGANDVEEMMKILMAPREVKPVH